MKTCSIVILNWNGASFLRKFLPQLLHHTSLPDVEIVVADNDSKDDSLLLLETNFPFVRRIVLDQNYGFAEGYNRALEHLQSRYFVLLNSDVEVTESWLEPLLSHMEENPECAACQPKILSYNQPSHFEHAGAAGGFIDKMGYPFCRGRILSNTEEDNGQYDDTLSVFWATGACLMVRSEVYRACGGLDNRFFAHMEEIDLCWRMQLLGFNIAAVPSSMVYHVGGGTLSVESPQKTYLNFRNNLLMLYKNLPIEQRRKVLFYRWFLDILAAIHLLLTSKPANARAVLRAQRDYKKMKKYYPTQPVSTKKDIRLSGVYDGSILLAFYLKGNRTFNSLFVTAES